MSTWHDAAPIRDITIHKGEDLDLSARFTRDGQPWTPPEGTTAYFRVWITKTTPTDIPATIVGNTLSAHIESSVADTIPKRASFWLYITTPDTPGGNPKVITQGKVNRVDPA